MSEVEIPVTIHNAQHKLREIKQLYERLERGQRMLDNEIEKGLSVAKCTEVIHHFNKLSAKLIHDMEELLLIQQFVITGIKMYIRRDGKLTSADELLEERIELTPHILLTLEKLKEVFGELPHDILEIK